MSEYPLLIPGGWTAILAQLPGLAAYTPQTVTWAQLLSDPGWPAVANSNQITMDKIDWSLSPLATVSLLSILLGQTTWNQVAAPSGNWCDQWNQLAAPYHCSGVTTDPRLGDPIYETEAYGGFPVDLTSLARRPISAINSGDRSGTFFNELGLLDLNIKGSFLNDVLISDIPTASRSHVVTCGSECPSTLGEAYDDGDVSADGIYQDLGDAISDATLSDVVLSFMDPAQLDWENMPLRDIAFERMGDEMGVTFRHYTLDYEVPCSDSQGMTASVQLPSSFRYRPGSTQTSADTGGPILLAASAEAEEGGPTISGDNTLTWDLSAFDCSGSSSATESVEVAFDAMTGFTLGTFTSDASVDADGVTASLLDAAPVTVGDGFAPDSQASGTAPEVTGNTMNVGHLTTVGDKAYFVFDADHVGDIVNVSLSHLSRDYDLVLYAPTGAQQQQALRSALPTPVPVGNDPLGDPAANGTQDAPPVGVQDIPILGNRVVAGVSGFKGSDLESITTTAVAGTNPDNPLRYLVQISEANGDHGNEPFVLTIRTSEADGLPACSPRTFPNAMGAAKSAPSASGPTINTLFLTNYPRLVAAFGSVEADAIWNKLAALASTTDTALNVKGAVFDVGSAAGASEAIADADPCSAAANNNAVRAINDAVDNLRTSNNLTGLQNIVIVGGDEIIHHAWMPDGTTDGNERSFTGDTIFQVGANLNRLGAPGAGYFMSDTPYAALRPLSVLGQTIYPMQVALGRLGGTSSTIKSAIDLFVSSHGLADPRTATTNPRKVLETDYDFFTDGGEDVSSTLGSQVGATNVTRLTGNGWTRTQFANALLPATTANTPQVISPNAHYDQYRLLPAQPAAAGTYSASDLFTTATLAASPANSMRLRLVFGIGCHMALDFPDRLAGAAPTGTAAQRIYDWQQAYVDKGAAVLIGNLGYGYGDTATIAFSERLMANLARYLDGSRTVGQALVAAERDYLTSMASFSPYDLKALQEAILWGMPMYRVPGALTATAPTQSAASASSSPQPAVIGDAAVTAAAAISPDPVSGIDSTTVDVNPTFTKITMPDGSAFYQANGGLTQATHPYPIVPKALKPLPTASGKIAKGAIMLGGTVADETGFKVTFANATIDNSANEPAPPTDTTYPTTYQSLGTFIGADGQPTQNLVVLAGQFRSGGPSSPGVGTMRRLTASHWLVTYGTAGGDLTPPEFTQVDGVVLNGNTSFTANVGDPDDAVVRVVVDALVGNTYQVVELQHVSGNRWTGGLPTDQVREFSVYALDAHGNSSSANDRGLSYIPHPPPPTNGLDLTVNGSQLANGWYSASPTPTVSVTPDSYRLSVDGGAPQDSPVSVSGDGIHQVDAVGEDGSVAGSVLVPIDNTPPTITILSPPGSVPTYYLNAVVPESYYCQDSGSGTTCSDNNPGGNLDTSTVGLHTFTVSATDFAGHTSTASRQYRVTYKFSGFFAPIDNPPIINYSKAGQSVPVKWQITDANGVGVNVPASFVEIDSIATPGACGGTADAVETYTDSNGLKSLGNGNWQFNWATKASYAGQCRTLILKLSDGVIPSAGDPRTAYFKFR